MVYVSLLFHTSYYTIQVIKPVLVTVPLKNTWIEIVMKENKINNTNNVFLSSLYQLINNSYIHQC